MCRSLIIRKLKNQRRRALGQHEGGCAGHVRRGHGRAGERDVQAAQASGQHLHARRRDVHRLGAVVAAAPAQRDSGFSVVSAVAARPAHAQGQKRGQAHQTWLVLVDAATAMMTASGSEDG